MGQVRRTRTLLASTALTALALVGAVLVTPSPSVAAGAASTDPVGCAVSVAPGEARCYAGARQPSLASAHGVKSFATVTDAPHGLGPDDIAELYDLPAIPDDATTGTGPVIALVEAGDVPDLDSELATYRDAYGLGTCSVADRCLSVVNQYGTTPLPAADDDWAWETMMDVEAVSAACPACKILVVEAESADTTKLQRAVATAADMANYVSMSWGTTDDGMRRSDINGLETIFESHPDVTFVASTGDFGWRTKLSSYDIDCGNTIFPSMPADTHSCTSYPASSPHVVAAGGTEPVSTSDGLTEEMWGAQYDDGSPNAGGVASGCSGWTTMNASQALNGRARGACGATRGSADISALADFFSLYHPGEDENGDTWHWWIGSGTSLAAPLLAAMYARAGNHTSPFDIYARATAQPEAFNDVTTGTPTRGCPAAYDKRHLCSAGTGWDGPTGLGTPHGLESLQTYDGPILADPTPAEYLTPIVFPVTTPVVLQPVGHAGKVKVKGKARVRAKLKASYGSFEAGSSITITWFANKKAVGHKATLKVKKAWLNRKVRYVVTASAANRTPLTLTSSAVKVKR